MLTGGKDGRVRVWSVQPSARSTAANTDIGQDGENVDTTTTTKEGATETNQDDVCFFMGTLLPPPNVSVSSEKISCLHYDKSGRFVGVLHANSKNVDVYFIRSTQESLKKRNRRLRRRQEKQKKKSSTSGEDEEATKKSSGRKRGILDDPESSGGDDDDEPDEENNENHAVDPESIKASDEFAYMGTVRASHKLRGFAFVPYKEKGELIRVVCALSTNALETHCLVRQKKKDG